MGRNSAAHRHGFNGGLAYAWTQVIRRRGLAALLGVTFLGAAHPACAAFSVDRIALHQFEDGPELGSTHAFLPGESVFFSCRLTGYQSAVTGENQRSVKLSWTLDVTDPAGIPLVAGTKGEIAEPILPQDKNWYPKFLHHFNIPPFAPGGAYHIKVTARDEVAKADVTSQLEFQVRGHAVEPSPVLAARNLRFVKDETDGPPLDPAVYHPGQTLWARFDMTGYKYGDNNHYSVEYGLAILRESGEQVFAQPAAAADSSEGVYPQRYVPGAVSLNLQPDVPEGSYTLVITMADKVGGQTAEGRREFRIQK
jgi:hypothetical protein